MAQAERELRTQRRLAVGLCAFALLYVFPYQATLNNPNENVRFYMTAALAEFGTYEIDALRQRWGYVNDAAARGGHLYSVKAPGTSLLGVPGYLVYLHGSRALGHAFDRIEALWVCRVTASVLPALAFAYALFGFLARRSRDPSLRNAIFFSIMLGSLLYGYAMMFVSHTTSAACAFGALALLCELHEGRREKSGGAAFAAGLLAAFVTFFEYPGVLCSLPLALFGAYVLRGQRRSLGAFVLGGALPALAMMHFQHRAFGSALTPGHLFVENAALRAAHHEGLYGAVGPSGAALYGLLLAPGAGLLPLTPLLWLSLPGCYLLLRERSTRLPAVVVCACVVLTVLGIASMNNWRGGWTVGPRYLAVCVPLLGWPALRALAALGSRAPFLAHALAVGGTLAGLIASGLPGAYYPHLPPELDQPLPQLYAVLIAHGFAPANAANLLGIFRGASMLPLAAAALLAVALCARDGSPFARLRGAGLGLALCAALLAPAWVTPSREPAVRKAVAFVARRYWPKGHDDAARLQVALAAQVRPRPDDVARLLRLYRDEGRDEEANAMSRRRR